MKQLLFALVFLCLVTEAKATTYWASTGGGAGTCGAASGAGDPGTYRTLAQAVACMSVGDEVVVKNGTYSIGSSSISLPTGGSSWNAGGFYTIRAQNNLGAIFLANWPFCTYNCNSAGYVKFQGFLMDGTGAGNSGTFTDLKGQTVGYANGPIIGGGQSAGFINHHLWFNLFEITRYTGIAVQLGGPNSVLSNSVVHDNGTTSNDNCVYLSDGSTNGLVENNHIYNCTGAGLQAYSSNPSTSSGAIIRWNNIHNVSSSPRILNGSYIEQPGPETRVDGINLSSGFDGSLIYGNVIHDMLLSSGADQGGINIMPLSGTSFTSVKVINNTVYNVNGEAEIIVQEGACNTVVMNNIAYLPHGGTLNTANYSQRNSHCAGTPAVFTTNVTTNPGFVNAGASNFRLAAASGPAYNTGTSPGSPFATATLIAPSTQAWNTDPDGISRPQSSIWDIGAFEFTGTSPAPLVAITSPATPTFTTNAASINMTGTSSQTTGAIVCASNRVATCTVSGTLANWTITGLTLLAGLNTITVTGTDALGNQGTATVVITYAPVFPGPTLVLAMGFETGSGTNSVDSSGANNPGTLIGGASWAGTSGGRYGNGLALGSNQYVNVNDSNSLDLSQGFTISAWVKPTLTSSTYKAIVHKNTGTAGGSPSASYELYASIGAGCGVGGLAGFSNANGVLGPYDTACNSTPLVVNQFTFVALTYDGANLRLYKGTGAGVTLLTTTPHTGYMESSALDLNIGGSEWGEYFQGIIDEVRIYNYAIPLTGGGNTTLGAPCNVAGNLLPAGTPSLTGDANCPVVTLSAPLQFKIGATYTFKIGASTEFKMGAQQ